MDESLEAQLAEAQGQVEELRKSLDQCSHARQITEREAEINAEKAQTAIEEMQHFLYAVNHDLRQPLRSILTNAQLLERKRPQDSELKEYTSPIIEGANEINTLIESLVSFSRVGTIQRRSLIRLDIVLQLALLKVQKLVKESNAQITYRDLPEAEVDESQFAQVFEHLLTNSIKYRSEEAPNIEVSAQEDTNAFKISVRDNGVGVKPDYHQTVFAPFKRLHGKNIPGVGLGLSICKKIVTAHGGKIWVESDGQNGSTFHFTVPV
jgi:signal transduction histidine kinase